MEELTKSTLAQAGVDVNSALGRLMGREDLLVRFLGEFPADGSYPALEEAVASGDRAGALAAAHTLKGLCGNLSMTRLFGLFTRQVDLLRGEDWAGACALMPEIARAYHEMVAAIRAALG